MQSNVSEILTRYIGDIDIVRYTGDIDIFKYIDDIDIAVSFYPH